MCVINPIARRFILPMIAMVTGPDGAPSILHRTYLTNDGRKAPVIEPRRLMPGSIRKRRRLFALRLPETRSGLRRGSKPHCLPRRSSVCPAGLP